MHNNVEAKPGGLSAPAASAAAITATVAAPTHIVELVAKANAAVARHQHQLPHPQEVVVL